MGIKAMVNKVNDLLANDCTIELSACVDRDGYPEYYVDLKWEPEGSPVVNEVRASYCILVALQTMLECVSKTIEPLQAARESLIAKIKTLPIEDLECIEESGIIEGWTISTQKDKGTD